MNSLNNQRPRETGQKFNGISIFGTRNTHDLCWGLCRQFIESPAKALDLGAGHGAFSRRLLDAGYDVTACDFDHEGWSVPEVKLLNLNLNQPFAQRLPEKYDLVVAIEVIEHLENPCMFLRECLSLLQPKGCMILSLPNILDYDSRHKFWRRGILYHYSSEHSRAIGHISILPCWLVEHHFEATGWVVAEKMFGAKRTAWSGSFAWLRNLLHPMLRRLLYLSTTREGWDEYTCNSVIYALQPKSA